MDENKNNAVREKEGRQWDIRQYMVIALVVFATFCCCILFFFLIYRYDGLADSWKNLVVILQPIIIGLVLAYLLNPVMKTVEQWTVKLLEPRVKNKQKVKKTARGVGIAGALLFLIGLLVLLISAVLPAMITSIQEIVASLPAGVNQLLAWIQSFTHGDTQTAEIANQVIERVTESFQDFLKNDVLSKLQIYLTQITTGVLSGVKLMMNILIGVIVSIYVMASKETFAGQAKKLLYAILKPVRANAVIQTVRKSNEIFGGFISGKLLDSAIIGVVAYIVLAIMKIPDTILIAVIVGVTNIIPFFGPFIGAIPSFIIIVLQDPMKGIYFAIFIIILQQIDGNIIGPKILGNSTGLSAFWVVFAIMVFGGVWGFVGMLIGVPTMAVIFYVAQQIVDYFLKKRGLATDTERYVHLVRVDKQTNAMIYEPEQEKKEKVKRETKKNK